MYNGNQKIYKPEVTEVCPHCDSENTMVWDIGKEGYTARCPRCGEKMMLCDECQHADDNPRGFCDWHDNCNGGTCFRDRKESIEDKKFCVTYRIDGRICFEVVAENVEQAKAKARNEYMGADLGTQLEVIDSEIIIVESNDGNYYD